MPAPYEALRAGWAGGGAGGYYGAQHVQCSCEVIEIVVRVVPRPWHQATGGRARAAVCRTQGSGSVWAARSKAARIRGAVAALGPSTCTASWRSAGAGSSKRAQKAAATTASAT